MLDEIHDMTHGIYYQIENILKLYILYWLVFFNKYNDHLVFSDIMKCKGTLKEYCVIGRKLLTDRACGGVQGEEATQDHLAKM